MLPLECIDVLKICKETFHTYLNNSFIADEIRNGGGCFACQNRGMTMAQILGRRMCHIKAHSYE